MTIDAVFRVANKVNGGRTQDTPQRGPRTRDSRAKERQATKALADAYRQGYTDELED